MRYIVFAALIISAMPVIGMVGYFLARIREGGAPNAMDLAVLVVMVILSFSVGFGAIWYWKNYQREQVK